MKNDETQSSSSETAENIAIQNAVSLMHGPQTCGLPAACGPRGRFVRTAMLFGNFEAINIYVI